MAAGIPCDADYTERVREEVTSSRSTERRFSSAEQTLSSFLPRHEMPEAC